MYMLDENGQLTTHEELMRRKEAQRMQQGQVQRMPEPRVNFQALAEPKQAQIPQPTQTDVQMPEVRQPTEQPVRPVRQPTEQPAQSSGGGGLLDRLLGTGDRRAQLGAELMMMSNMPQFQKLGAARMEGIASAAEERKKLEQAQAQTNKTIAYLESINRSDLVAAIKGGMSPADAIKEARTKPERDKLVEGKDGSWRNPYTGEVVVPGPKGGPALDPKEQLAALNSLRDDVRTDLGTFNATQDAWSKISYLYENQSGTSDYALTVAFANILDPGSIVTGQEQESIARSGAISDALKKQVINALNGEGTLPAKVRDEIMAIARDRYVTQLGNAKTTLSMYTETANRYGVDPNLIWRGDMSDPQQLVSGTPPQAVINAVDPADPDSVAEWWNTLSRDERLAEIQKIEAR